MFLDKSQHLVHALFLREDGLRGARSTDFSEHLRQLPPDAAEQFHTVKLVVVIHGVQCVKFTEKSQDGEIFFLFCREDDIPDPDLLIRTSGEQRLSNYLLWQLAYTEFYFTDVLWPDFTKKELEKAIEQYNRRDRRYGGVKEA